MNRLVKNYGCVRYGHELYEVYPPDDVYTVSKRFKDRDEEAIRIQVVCEKCKHKNTIFWVKP